MYSENQRRRWQRPEKEVPPEVFQAHQQTSGALNLLHHYIEAQGLALSVAVLPAAVDVVAAVGAGAAAAPDVGAASAN